MEIDSRHDSLADALKRVGYAAATAQVVVISGPSSSSSAMGVLRDRYCEALLDPQFSEIGISRERSTWHIVLARPLIPADLGGWTYAGKEILDLVNQARARARNCGTQKFGPARPVDWNAKLGSAALAHSRDMAMRNYFAHSGTDRSTVEDRVSREGYDWSAVGENIAAGQGSVEQAVSSWLASPHHCVNIMQPAFTEMGAAYFIDRASESVIYWTQVFGTPRR